MILEWRKKRRVELIQKAISTYLIRVKEEVSFAEQEAKLPHNACLTDWINLNAGDQVLELGCGSGRFVAILAKLGFNVVGIDPYYFDTWKLFSSMPRVSLYEKIYAEALPFENASFDHICCLSALLYFEDPNKSLSEMYRVLKPGGRLLLRSLNAENLYTRFNGKKIDPTSKQLYTKNEILSLVRKHNFKIVKHFTFGFYAPFFPNFYWYLHSVYINNKWQEILSNYTPKRYRTNHIIYAIKQ